MATRSYIGIENDDKTVDYIYCHWDGYPNGVGGLLYTIYDNKEKLKELIKLGSLSSLKEKIHPTGKHSFDNPEDDVCIFYGRDRGETGVEFATAKTKKDFFNDAKESYNYLFTKDNKWVYKSYSSVKSISLEKTLFKYINDNKIMNLPSFCDISYSAEVNKILTNKFLLKEAEKEKKEIITNISSPEQDLIINKKSNKKIKL